MRKLLLCMLMAANLGTGFAQQRGAAHRTKGLVVAFFDEQRLKTYDGGEATLENFAFFLKPIQEIAKRDFSDIEFRVLRRGELLRLPDGTALNVQNMREELGYVFSVPGKKNRVLSGVQSDADFACAAAAFFRRSSPACSK